MKKEKLVYSTEKGGTVEEDLAIIRRKIQHMQERQDPEAYARLLIFELDLDPESDSFKQRMASFRRACNLPN
jgi:hypothetical protein